MRIPLNSTAEAIVTLQNESEQFRLSILSLEAKIQQNADLIAVLEPSAEWGPDA